MIALAFLLPIGHAARAAEPTEAVAWNFADGVQDWQGNRTSPLEIVDDALTFRATGSDVLIVGPLFDIEPALCDTIEITLKSTTEGICEWFWRSDTEGPYGGFSGERRLQVAVEAHDDWQTLRVQPFWQDAERVVGLRFDPPEGKPGTYAIQSIKVLKFDRPGPVEADFDFTRGDEGWVVPAGDTEQRQAGLHVMPTSRETRAISPHLDLDAADARYLIIEATAPAIPGPDGHVPAFIEFMAKGDSTRHAVPFTMAPAVRSTYNIRVGDHPGWRGGASRR